MAVPAGLRSGAGNSFPGAHTVMLGQTRALMNNAVALAGADHEQPIRDEISCNAGRTVCVAALADYGGEAIGAGVDLAAEDRFIVLGFGLWWTVDVPSSEEGRSLIADGRCPAFHEARDRKSTRLNSSHYS